MYIYVYICIVYICIVCLMSTRSKPINLEFFNYVYFCIGLLLVLRFFFLFRNEPPRRSLRKYRIVGPR